MTDLIKSENYVSFVYEKLIEKLVSELQPFLASPSITLITFRIDFKRDIEEFKKVSFYLTNGTLNGKMINLHHNNSVTLNYAFRLGEEEDEAAKGLFKVKITEGIV